MTSKRYDENLDRDFFASVDVSVVQHAPWQFGLFHPDVEGKFVWYPERGSLIYEKPGAIVKIGEFTNSEEVWDEIKKKLN